MCEGKKEILYGNTSDSVFKNILHSFSSSLPQANICNKKQRVVVKGRQKKARMAIFFGQTISESCGLVGSEDGS